MPLARTHKRLVPFGGKYTLSSVLFHLGGFLVVEGFALNDPAATIVVFVITYIEMLLIALGLRACWKVFMRTRL
jgi:hypothetical protein